MLVGANLTDKTMDPPAGIVYGTVNPLTLNPVAYTDSPEIFADALPVFVTVTAIVLLEPTGTEPKLPGDGSNESVPEGAILWPSATIPENASARNTKVAYQKYRRIRRSLG